MNRKFTLKRNCRYMYNGGQSLLCRSRLSHSRFASSLSRTSILRRSILERSFPAASIRHRRRYDRCAWLCLSSRPTSASELRVQRANPREQKHRFLKATTPAPSDAERNSLLKRARRARRVRTPF